MTKKNKRKKYVPLDVNNPPKNMNAKKPDKSPNTSSDLSAVSESSTTNESSDSVVTNLNQDNNDVSTESQQENNLCISQEILDHEASGSFSTDNENVSVQADGSSNNLVTEVVDSNSVELKNESPREHNTHSYKDKKKKYGNSPKRNTRDKNFNQDENQGHYYSRVISSSIRYDHKKTNRSNLKSNESDKGSYTDTSSKVTQDSDWETDQRNFDKSQIFLEEHQVDTTNTSSERNTYTDEGGSCSVLESTCSDLQEDEAPSEENTEIINENASAEVTTKGSELNANAATFVPISGVHKKSYQSVGEVDVKDENDLFFEDQHKRTNSRNNPEPYRQPRKDFNKRNGRSDRNEDIPDENKKLPPAGKHFEREISPKSDPQKGQTTFPQKDERQPGKGWQQRRGGSLGYPEKQDWRGRDDSENKKDQYTTRHSEGGDYKSKESGTSFKKPSLWSDSRVMRQNRDVFDRSFENIDTEYKKYQEEKRNNAKVEFVRVREITQDLFQMPKEYSLGHCVAEDMRMGSGIAVSFKRDFKDIDVLLSQRQRQGGLAVLEQDSRFIYYLVTKRLSTGKPTYETLWTSLKKMRDHMKENKVEKLAIPRLGCGLDRLEWTNVKHMIEFLFKEVEVDITVCNFQQSDESPEKPHYTCKVVNVKKPIADIEEETSIIYLSSEDGHVSAEMEQLSNKFNFLSDFKRAPKKLGDVIKYQVPKKYYILNGCIVRKKHNDPFDFRSFFKCIQQINKDCKKEQYVYLGIQAIKDEDDLINEKIITLLKNCVSTKIEIYVCWDGDLVLEMPLSRD